MSIKITKTPLILIILAISSIIFLEPQGFKEDSYVALNSIDTLYRAAKIIAAVTIAAVYFYVRKWKTSKLVLASLIFCVFNILSTIINDGEIMRLLGPLITMITMILIAEIAIAKNIFYRLLKIIIIYFRFTFIIHIFSILLIDFVLQDATEALYLYGIDNRWIFSYLPWVVFEILYSKNHKLSPKIPIVVGLLCELTLLYKFSLAAMLLLPLLFISLSKKNFTKHIPAIFIGTLLTNFSIVILRIQNLFTTILSLASKGTSLSGRTYLWDSVFNATSANPLLGKGMMSIQQEKEFYVAQTGVDYLAVSHSHNTYMTVLFRYGIIGLALYFNILLLSLANLRNTKNQQTANILLVAIIVTLLLGIFDTMDYSAFYFILASAYSINAIKD